MEKRRDPFGFQFFLTSIRRYWQKTREFYFFKQLLGCMVIIVLRKGAALGLRPFSVVQVIRSGPGEYSHRIMICCTPKLNEYFCLIMR
ncbi:hypothetical protein ANACOL_01473 [Anaerotruncus colihominis DSM 17241]|uniref:Uncharacterized protein n=1 Tax=Anaerotruncus colihominis DSM 17241 TaxID=445972 RepID=B0P9Q4_9FIRM|nr:hypothetical protein ANACOL_01473 [Anaerotruncus colihominis DSM 17241]